LNGLRRDRLAKLAAAAAVLTIAWLRAQTLTGATTLEAGDVVFRAQSALTKLIRRETALDHGPFGGI
jgi:hypothetical protein